jgi:hypothetical protein
MRQSSFSFFDSFYEKIELIWIAASLRSSQ